MSKLTQQRRRGAGRQVSVNLDYMLCGISFPSIEDSLFRFISNVNDDGSFVLKVEKVKASQQWQVMVKDLSQHGPSGLPKEAVMSALKTSLQFLSTNSSVRPSSNVNQDPSVDGEMDEEGSLVLYLYIPIVGFPVEYIFKMALISRERIDILETSLHEAREEIDVLTGQIAHLKAKLEDVRDEAAKKEALNPMITVLRTTQSAGTSSLISWNTTELNTLSATLNSNKQLVSIPKAGIYQIHIRVTGPDSGAQRHINLQINGVVAAQSICGFNTGYNCSLNLTEFKELKSGDTLGVHYTSNQNMDAQIIYTHFSILYMGPLHSK